MKPYKGLFHAAVVAALLVGFSAMAPESFAQGRSPQPHHAPPPERPDLTPRPAGVREKQMIMDEMSRVVETAEPERSPELRIAEIAEDYRELQRVNNGMMTATMRASEPDYELIVKSVTDIRRRARRMLKNLALPEPPAEEKSQLKEAQDAAALKAALLILDRSVMSFVRSPLFKNPDVVDANTASKASRDLTDVVELTSRALKDAERLGKKVKN